MDELRHSRWRHKKTGGEYLVSGKATLQTSKPIEDMQQLVLYIAQDGSLWVRPVDEFMDGRFEALP